MNKQIKIEIISGVAGECLLVNDYRVSGQEALGGGTIVKTFSTDIEKLKIALGLEENSALKEKLDSLIKHRSTIIDHAISLEKEVIQLKNQIKEL